MRCAKPCGSTESPSMTSRSKSAKACGAQTEGENIDEISISMPSYFPPTTDEDMGAFSNRQSQRTLHPIDLLRLDVVRPISKIDRREFWESCRSNCRTKHRL